MNRRGASLPQISHKARNSGLPCLIGIQGYSCLAPLADGRPFASPGGNAREAENQAIFAQRSVLPSPLQGIDGSLDVDDRRLWPHGTHGFGAIRPQRPVTSRKQVLWCATVETATLQGMEEPFGRAKRNEKPIRRMLGDRTGFRHAEVSQRQCFRAELR